MSPRNAVVDNDDPPLDAARACVLAVGVPRTTLTDVARRAGMSRMTLYRRFPDLEVAPASCPSGGRAALGSVTQLV